MIRVFIEPCDILFFRDDLPFGTEGSQVARCQFPPRPSVIAGALRTKALTAQGVDFGAFRVGQEVPDLVRKEIGVGGGPENELTPGTFRLAGLYVGYCPPSEQGQSFYRAGRDLIVEGKNGRSMSTSLLAPREVALPGVSSQQGLRPISVTLGHKPVEGWLSANEYVTYLLGQEGKRELVKEATILSRDYRVGIGLDGASGVVDEGRLFSSQGVVLKDGWGLVAVVDGCTILPAAGLIRLGGDARMARISPWPIPEPDWSPIRDLVIGSRRFRWILQTPAIFENGWLPRAVERAQGELLYRSRDFTARLVSASVGAPTLAGGWDLVRGRPKEFRRLVPAGSVYWLEVTEGDPKAAWDVFHGRSVSDERENEGFGVVHVGGWSYV